MLRDIKHTEENATAISALLSSRPLDIVPRDVFELHVTKEVNDQWYVKVVRKEGKEEGEEEKEKEVVNLAFWLQQEAAKGVTLNSQPIRCSVVPRHHEISYYNGAAKGVKGKGKGKEVSPVPGFVPPGGMVNPMYHMTPLQQAAYVAAYNATMASFYNPHAQTQGKGQGKSTPPPLRTPTGGPDLATLAASLMKNASPHGAHKLGHGRDSSGTAASLGRPSPKNDEKINLNLNKDLKMEPEAFSSPPRSYGMEEILKIGSEYLERLAAVGNLDPPAGILFGLADESIAGVCTNKPHVGIMKNLEKIEKNEKNVTSL